MRIAVITPTKGDRPHFLRELYKMIQVQTIQPDIHIVVDDVHDCDYSDVTWRYKLGFKRAREQGADVFVIMEDDDWYAPTYIQMILTEWARNNKPNLFGIGVTIYYNIVMRKYRLLRHPRRASMMAMVVRSDTSIIDCEDENPYLDMYLWTKRTDLTKATILFDEPIAIGIKHGMGLFVGGGHKINLGLYNKGVDDSNMEFLERYVGNDLINFYKVLTK